MLFFWNVCVFMFHYFYILHFYFFRRICSRALWRVVQMFVRPRILDVWWWRPWCNCFNTCIGVIISRSNGDFGRLWESIPLFLSSCTASLWCLHCWRSARLFRYSVLEQTSLLFKCSWLSNSLSLDNWHMLGSSMSTRRVKFMTRPDHFRAWLSDCRSHVLRVRHGTFLSRCCEWVNLHQYKI